MHFLASHSFSPRFRAIASPPGTSSKLGGDEGLLLRDFGAEGTSPPLAAELEARMGTVEQSAAANEPMALPEGRALLAAAKSIDKASRVA